MSNVMGIYVKFTKSHSLNMVMSRDPGFKFGKVLVLSNFILSFRKSYKIWGKLAQEQKGYRQKTNWGWKRPPSAYRVKWRSLGARSKFWGYQSRRIGVAVTTVSTSLILRGWVTKMSKNGDKKQGGGRVDDNNILTFCPTVLDTKCHFPVYF